MIRIQTEKLTELEQEIEEWKRKLEILQREYQNLPGFTKINMALDQEKDGRLLLARITDEYNQKEVLEKKIAEEKNSQYQIVLHTCKSFPYGRTGEAYKEAMDALEAYRSLCQEICQCLLKLENEKRAGISQEEAIEENQARMDDAFFERDKYSNLMSRFTSMKNI